RGRTRFRRRRGAGAGLRAARPPSGLVGLGGRTRPCGGRSRVSRSSAALRVAPAPLQVLLLPLDAGVEAADVVSCPHHVRRPARARCRGPVPRSLAGRMPGVREEAVTEVAECVAAMMGEEAVLAMPAVPVGGVERVEVDVPPVTVERRAAPGGL